MLFLFVVCCLGYEENLISGDGTRFRNEPVADNWVRPVDSSHFVYLVNASPTVKNTSSLTIEEITANITFYNNTIALFNSPLGWGGVYLYNYSQNNPYQTCQDLCAYLFHTVGCGGFYRIVPEYDVDDDFYYWTENVIDSCYIYQDYVTDMRLREAEEICSSSVESECCDSSFTKNDTCVSVKLLYYAEVPGASFYVRVPDVPALVSAFGYEFQPLGTIVNRDFYYNNSLYDICSQTSSCTDLKELVTNNFSDTEYIGSAGDLSPFELVFFTVGDSQICAGICAYINENTTFDCGGYVMGDADYICSRVDPELLSECLSAYAGDVICSPLPMWMRNVCPYGHPRPHVPCNASSETVCYNGSTTDCGYYDLAYKNNTTWDLYVLTTVPPTSSPTEIPTHVPTIEPTLSSPTIEPTLSSPTDSPVTVSSTVSPIPTAKSTKLISYTDIAIGAAVGMSVIIMLVAVYFANSPTKKGYVKLSKK